MSHPPNGMVFWLAFLCTCVSVHRRDRCTRTFLFHYFVPALLFRVHAPPPCAMIQNCNSLFTKVKRTTLFKIMVCAALSLWWFCGPLDALPCWALGLVFWCCCRCVSLSPWFCCAPLCAWVGPAGSVLLFAFFGSSLCLVLISLVPFGALVQFFAGTSLWVSGCSCDGLVALLLCWECGCALSSFRQMSHGSKGY